jgi:hypothetical protein
MAAGVDIRDEVSPLLKALPGTVRTQVPAAVGAGVKGLFQENFRKLGTNRNNWPSTGFWGQAVRATNFSLPAVDEVRINVNKQGVLQRWKGGEIKAKPGGWLTIPARSEAYGKRAREFNNLEAIFFKTGQGFFGALVESASQDVSFGRARKDGSRKVTPGLERGGGVMFWLKKSVRQDADPRVVPSPFEIGAVVIRTVNGIIDRFKARGGNN